MDAFMSAQLQQRIEATIHSITNELVQQLLSLPNITHVELAGHLGATVNNFITFPVFPRLGKQVDWNETKPYATTPEEDQSNITDWPAVSFEIKQEPSECTRSIATQTVLGDTPKNSPENFTGTEQVETIQDAANTSANTIFHNSAAEGNSQESDTFLQKVGAAVVGRHHPARKRRGRKKSDCSSNEEYLPSGNLETSSDYNSDSAACREGEKVQPGDPGQSPEVGSSSAQERHDGQETKQDGDTVAEMQCPVCDKKYPGEKRSAFKRHVKKHSQSVQCETCGKWLANQDSLRQHQRGLHDAEKPFTCEECGMSFNFRHSYKLHCFKHSGTRPHACPHCPKTYLTPSHLRVHLVSRHSAETQQQARYQCEICGRSFTSANSLKNHSFRHSDIKPYHCDVCSKGFNSRSALKAHGQSVHVTERKFGCDVCHKFYKSAHILGIHKRKHSQEQNSLYICDVCGRQFQSPYTLKTHTQTHQDICPYVCKTCGKGFKLASSLYSHQNTHKIEKPYQCSLCPKVFKTKTLCLAHERRHNATKSFVCQTCRASFPDKGGLDKHTRTIHTPVKMFQCTICGKTGTRMDNMRTHIKSHGRDWTVEQTNACIKQFSS